MSGIGRFVHERVVLDRLESAFQARGYQTDRPCAVRSARGCGHIDMAVITPAGRIAVEVELSAKRIRGDIAKATAMEAIELWLVVPNALLMLTFERSLAGLGFRGQMRRFGRWFDGGGIGIVVLTLGQALQRVSHSFPIVFRGECEVEIK